VTSFVIRDAVASDMTGLSGVYRRSSLFNELVLDMIAIARGRGIGRVEVTANPHALAFYEKAGFVVYREVVTRFKPAPRMRLDVTA
jgi:hypothetical protein